MGSTLVPFKCLTSNHIFVAIGPKMGKGEREKEWWEVRQHVSNTRRGERLSEPYRILLGGSPNILSEVLVSWQKEFKDQRGRSRK